MTTPTHHESIEERVRTIMENRRESLLEAFQALPVQLVTKCQFFEMARNAAHTEVYQTTCDSQVYNPPPVIKLFTPDAQATWLLSEIDLDCPHIAFGLCDLGLGFPELGYVDLMELSHVRGRFGLPVERDLHFSPTQTLLEYANAARAARQILS